jgi:CAAX prenyl protease-like protein
MFHDLTKHPGFSRSLPFALFIFLLAVELSWTSLQPMIQGLQSLDKRWLYGIKSGLAALALIWLWARFEELKTLPRQLGGWVMAIITGVGIFVLWINLTQSWALLGEMGKGFDPHHADGQMDWLLAGIRLAGSALVVPIMEELFWRSFIMRWIDKPDFLLLDPRKVSHRSLLISSALFALEHTQWFAGFLAGFAYGWLYRKTGKLWLPILAHAITNAMLGLWVLNTGNWRFW